MRLLPLLALHLALLCSALRRYPEEEPNALPRPLDVGFPLDEDQEDLPDLGEGPDEPPGARIGMERARGLHDTPFKNVLLVVHCRLVDRVVSQWTGKPTNSTAFCEKRRPLFRSLGHFFPEILFWRGEVECHPGVVSPHNCIAEQLLDRAKGFDGIFYMHFDALVRPEVLKRSFDLEAIGTFNEHRHCGVDDGCDWPTWKWKYVRDSLAASVEASAEQGFPVERTKFWLGVDDLFYIPKRVFGPYAELVKVWQGVHHEAAGPTMWRILSRHSGVPVVSLGCTGSCCSEVTGPEALAPGFRCGHPFRLNSADVRRAFAQAQLLA